MRWIACPYLRGHSVGQPGQPSHPTRRLVVAEVLGAPAPGVWHYFECGGGPGTDYLCGVGVALVQDDAVDAVLAAGGVKARALPAPLVTLDTLLSEVNNPTRNTLERTLTKQLGYTDPEIDGWLAGADIATKTLGEYFAFLTTRWYRPVYEPLGSQDANTNEFSNPGSGAFPGVVACDGRTTSTGATSAPWPSLPRSPSAVYQFVAG